MSLRDVCKGMADAVPDGWRTSREIAHAEGMSESYTIALLRKGVNLGMWEVVRYRIDVGAKVYPVPHYREVKRKGKK